MCTLVLGDGNLSFSLSLVKRVMEIPKEQIPLDEWKLIATTFDCKDKLVEKYPESQHILEELSSSKCLNHVLVMHEIDAIHVRDSFEDQSIDQIIFNFPHLGFEDLHRHQAFLCHLFVSCKCILKRNGIIHVALAETQEYGWKIKEAGAKNGYALIDKILLEESHWPGYHFRRHQTGKSFRQRVGTCFHYSFSLSGESPTINILSLLFQRGTENQQILNSNFPSNSLDSLRAVEPTSQQKHQENKIKKRKMHQLVEGRFRLVDSADLSAGGPTYECVTCSKRFPTEQGVRTHVYTIHVLPESSSQTLSTTIEQSTSKTDELETCEESLNALRPKKRQQLCEAVLSLDSERRNDTELVCTDCDRSFQNLEALAQHRLAKHMPSSSSSTVPPHMNDTTSSFASEQADVDNCNEECEICGWKLHSLQDRQDHHSLFAPRDLLFDTECELCRRRFANQRSFSQHRQVCQLLHSPR